MNKKFPILTPRSPEDGAGGRPNFLRDHREAADRAIAAEVTAAHSGDEARTVVNPGPTSGPTPGAPWGDSCTQSHGPEVNARRCPSVRRVAA